MMTIPAEAVMTLQEDLGHRRILRSPAPPDRGRTTGWQEAEMAESVPRVVVAMVERAVARVGMAEEAAATRAAAAARAARAAAEAETASAAAAAVRARVAPLEAWAALAAVRAKTG